MAVREVQLIPPPPSKERPPEASPSEEQAGAYRQALWTFWTLSPDAAPEVYNSARDEVLLAEAALPQAEAWTILREEAERFHAETGVCPFCQEPGELHLPATSPTEELNSDDGPDPD